MDKKTYLYNFFASNTKRFVIYITILIILILLPTILFFNFSKTEKTTKNSFVKTIPQFQKVFLDDRFLTAYGKVSDIGSGLIKIEIIKDQKFTDYVFNNEKEIDLFIDNSVPINKFNEKDKVYSKIKILDIKIGDFVTAYIHRATSSGYRAINVSVFNENIIK